MLLWQGQHEEAMEVCQQGMQVHAENPDLQRLQRLIQLDQQPGSAELQPIEVNEQKDSPGSLSMANAQYFFARNDSVRGTTTDSCNPIRSIGLAESIAQSNLRETWFKTDKRRGRWHWSTRRLPVIVRWISHDCLLWRETRERTSLNRCVRSCVPNWSPKRNSPSQNPIAFTRRC